MHHFDFSEATGSNAHVNRAMYTPVIKIPSLNKVTAGYTIILREELKLLV